MMGTMRLVIFEDSTWVNFAPLSLTRPVFTLTAGLSSLLQKQLAAFRPTHLTLWVRPGLEEYCRKNLAARVSIPMQVNSPLDDEPALLVSARMVDLRPGDLPGETFVAAGANGTILAAAMRQPGLAAADAVTNSAAWKKLSAKSTGPIGRPAEFLWDLIAWNAELIGKDAAGMASAKPRASAGVHLLDEKNLYVDPQARIAPGCVLDGSHGPVVIEAGAELGANCVLQGPCYVGSGSVVRALTLIRAGSGIGPECKVGGEISNSIILGRSNKAHDGYLGDSYLGEWVNLGAGTNTSNLKNTYGSITLRIGSRQAPTGRQFLGSLVGDHSKTAIGTRLMTGTYVGCCSQYAASGLPPKFVPSFSFWTDQGSQPYRMEKAEAVARAVYGRRGKSWESGESDLLRFAAAAAKIAEA
jgi:UDP-N-acetylglucosamine diphosphorylase / glucose-1-phosphate thymidylyltransferase / UDP-N-acetylgalactosamine diphosphorylase / glucosamine-1-phosphate N-acetyltransferase / galactosamine-1-phosphate N-acetyltransferase